MRNMSLYLPPLIFFPWCENQNVGRGCFFKTRTTVLAHSDAFLKCAPGQISREHSPIAPCLILLGREMEVYARKQLKTGETP